MEVYPSLSRAVPSLHIEFRSSGRQTTFSEKRESNSRKELSRLCAPLWEWADHPQTLSEEAEVEREVAPLPWSPESRRSGSIIRSNNCHSVLRRDRSGETEFS